MGYKIISKEQFKVEGVSKHISNQNDENFKVIPKFWNEVCEDGTYEVLDKNRGSLGALGICYNFDKELGEFDYVIAIERETVVCLENYKIVNIPKHSWAVFKSIGPMPNPIQDVIHKIYAEWFPATKYEHAGGPELEVYLPGDMNSEDYKCEVWIPVIKKV